MTNNEQKLLDEVMDWFDFHKVAKVIQHLQWTWYNCDSPGGIPTEPDLRAGVRKQFTRLINEGRCDKKFVCATGGFEYTIWKNENGCAEDLELKFVCCDWSTAG